MLRLLQRGIGRLATRFCLYNALENGNIWMLIHCYKQENTSIILLLIGPVTYPYIFAPKISNYYHVIRISSTQMLKTSNLW